MRPYRLWAAIALALLLVVGSVASAKEFTLPDVRINAHINTDGSMLVAETRTYSFDGSFSWASMWLPTTNSQTIENVVVAEGEDIYTRNDSEAPGTYQVVSTPEKTDIKWFYKVQDEERVFTISYVVRNAVQVYSDVAELYWQFIGKGWDVPSKHAEVLVTLPGAAPTGEMRVWGHGPLHGNVQIVDASTARWQVTNLPAHTFLEARLTFPPNLVPQAGLRQNKARLPEVLAEEEAWAEQANRIRAKARLDTRVAAYVVLLLILGTIAFWFRYGRPYPSEFRGEYYREPPFEHTPAVLGVMWRGASSTQDITATLLDLLRRKVLSVEPVADGVKRKPIDVNFAFTKAEGAAHAGLSQNEQMLLELLFARVAEQLPPDQPVTISDIKKYAKRHPSRVNTWYSNWAKEAQRAANEYHFLDTTIKSGRITAGIVSAILFVVGLVLVILHTYLYTGIVLMVSGFVAMLCATVTKRFTPTAQTEYRKWQAFRRFLRHFSDIKDAPVLSVAIWEQYLVYAVVLGVAKEVIRRLQAITPELANDPAYVNSWLYSVGHTGGFEVGTLCDAFVSSVQVAMSQTSSGSGGGGGFSSGGGGGGGGGGGSAG